MLRRTAALLLTAALATVLLPAGQGAAQCPRCGQVGRCCCLLRGVPAPGAHCARVGDRAACAMKRPATAPAGMRAAQILPDRSGALHALLPPPSPGLAGRLAGADTQRIASVHRTPPLPPPRILRLA